MRSDASGTLVVVLALFKSITADNIDCGTYTINDDLLTLHNEKRKIHNSIPLKSNRSLEESSLQHARVLAQKRMLYHDAHGVGENLFSWAGSKLPTPYNKDPGAVKGWYDEVECYCGYETAYPPCVYGHFTQLIWNRTTHVGCATCLNNQPSPYLVVVCRYYPSGNWCGDYKNNVGGPFGKPNNTLYHIVKAYVGDADSHHNVEKRLMSMLILFLSLNFYFEFL